MIPIPGRVRVWIATGHTDMRRGMQGLSLLVQEHLGHDPFGGDVFVFGRVPGRGVGAVGKSPAVATAESLAEAGDLSTAVVTVAVLGRVGLRDATLTQGPPR